MTFAFYLGAGNIIFPPLAGFMAGEHLSLAMLGFLVTAVGLPLITIIAVAKAGNGWAGMTKLLPAGVATALAVHLHHHRSGLRRPPYRAGSLRNGPQAFHR